MEKVAGSGGDGGGVIIHRFETKKNPVRNTMRCIRIIKGAALCELGRRTDVALTYEWSIVVENGLENDQRSLS